MAAKLLLVRACGSRDPRVFQRRYRLNCFDRTILFASIKMLRLSLHRACGQSSNEVSRLPGARHHRELPCRFILLMQIRFPETILKFGICPNDDPYRFWEIISLDATMLPASQQHGGWILTGSSMASTITVYVVCPQIPLPGDALTPSS